MMLTINLNENEVILIITYLIKDVKNGVIIVSPKSKHSCLKKT